MARYFTLLIFLCASMCPSVSAMAQALPVAGGETRGLVRSSARIEVRTDLAASVKLAEFDDGMRFEKGDTLIEFNCARYRAEFRAAQAAANASHIEVRTKRKLVSHGAAGKSELQLAQARAAQAQAEVLARKTRLDDCVITAPFSGRVVALNTRAHEMPRPNEPVIVILNDTALELELVVPSNWLNWLKTGSHFQFRVDETGQKLDARIVRLGAEVDPVSQTIKVFGRLDGGEKSVLAGMSGTASFSAGG